MSPIGTAARLALIGVALVATLASSSSQEPPPAAPQPYPGAAGGPSEPPASAPMEAGAVHGLWKTSFGPVKIEADPKGPPGALSGVWVYQKQGQQVIGYFEGVLDGNVLRFGWSEPGELTGEGWLAFDPSGQRFSGQWWTSARDRSGEWTGERAGPATAPAPAEPAPPPPGDAEQAPAGGPPQSI